MSVHIVLINTVHVNTFNCWQYSTTSFCAYTYTCTCLQPYFAKGEELSLEELIPVNRTMIILSNKALSEKCDDHVGESVKFLDFHERNSKPI